MNKLKVAFIGNNGEYEEVRNTQRFPKWDFRESNKSSLECIVMDKKRISTANGDVTLVTFISRHTKEPGVFFCGAVLEDKLREVPVHSCVKIEFEGKHPQKKYYQFRVLINKAFRFSPDEYNLDKYEEAETNETAKSTSNQTGNTTSPVTSQRTAPPIEEDLPF